MISYKKFVSGVMSEKKIVKRNYRYICKYIDYMGSDITSSIKIIYDIGANVGVYSVCFSKLFPNAIIYAFEPVPDTFSILKKNIFNFGLLNRVFVYNTGFWKEKCFKKMGFPKNRLSDLGNIGLFSVYGTEKLVDVKLTTLDEWSIENDISPDLLKIDTEGSEYNILLGGLKTIEKSRYIICEENKNYNGNEIRKILSPNFNLMQHIKTGDSFWAKKGY